MADEHDLGSCAARRAGSSPAFPTQEGVALATTVAPATLFELLPGDVFDLLLRRRFSIVADSRRAPDNSSGMRQAPPV